MAFSGRFRLRSEDVRLLTKMYYEQHSPVEPQSPAPAVAPPLVGDNEPMPRSTRSCQDVD